jgi:sortase (surface protein transpeptidase)
MNKIKIKHNPRKRKQIVWAVLVLAWVCLAGYVGFYLIQKATQKPGITTTVVNGVETTIDETPITEQAKNEHTVPADNPRYISIPDLGIQNARVVGIGLVKNTSQLDAPISIHDAGWYTASVKPGAGTGALLMDGHNGGPNYGGIFEKLGNLKAGAKIIIERGDGQKITYEVRDNRQMTVDEINNADNKWGMSTMLNSIEAGKEGLNIITCVGQWLQDSQTFNSRVMLRAVRTE